MTCQQIRKRLDAWVAGELTDAEDRAIARHVDTCTACTRRATDLRRLRDLLERLPPATPPPALFRRTLQAYRLGIDRPGMAEWWRSLSLVMRGAVCGAALAGLLCGAVLGTRLITIRPDGSAAPYQTLYASEGFYP